MGKYPGILSVDAGESSLMESFSVRALEGNTPVESKQTVEVMKMAAAAGLDLNEKCATHVGPWFHHRHNIVEEIIQALQYTIEDESQEAALRLDHSLRRLLMIFDGGADVTPAAVVSALWEYVDVKGGLSVIDRSLRPPCPLLAALQLMIREISFPAEVDLLLVDNLIGEKMSKIAFYKRISSRPLRSYLDLEQRGKPSVRSEFVRWLDHYMELSNVQRDADLRQEGEEPTSCPICAEDMISSLVLTSCGHQFHEKCISTWLRGGGQGKCAICKTRVDQSKTLRHVPPLRNLQCTYIDDEKKRCPNHVVQTICPTFLIPVSTPNCPDHLIEHGFPATRGRTLHLSCMVNNCPHKQTIPPAMKRGVRHFYGE